MKAGLYARVSTKEQAVEGFSIEAQLRATRQHCALHGYEVVDEYVDEGLSASKESAASRPQFRRLLQDLEAKRIDTVVVHKLDRLSRRLSLTLQTAERLQALGAELVSLSEELDRSTPNGRLMVNFFASIAEWYSDNLASEVSKGRRERFDQGLPNGDVPFGYRTPTPRMPPEIVEEEATLIRAVFERYASGQYAFSQLATWLNGQGVKTRSKRGDGRFTADSVRDMVCNSIYRGMIKYRGEERPGRHQAIVTDSLWNRCQEVRAERRTAPSAVKASKSRRYLLQGIGRCASCGGRLWCQETRRESRYQDNARRRKHDCEATRGSVACRVVDEQIGALISNMAIDDRWLDYGETILVADDAEAGDAGRERTRLKERLSRLKELYLDGEIGSNRWKTEGAAIRAQLEALDAASREETEYAELKLGEFADCWHSATHAEKADFCQLVFEAVWVDLETGRVAAVKPRPAFREALRNALQWRGDPERIRTADLHLDRVAC